MIEEKLYLAIVFIVEAIIAWLYFEILFERKRTQRSLFTSLFLGYSFLYIVLLVDNVALNTFCFFIINLLLLRTSYICKIGTAVLHTAFLSIVMSATEMLMALLLITVSNDYAAYQYNLTVLIALAVSSKLLYLLIAMAIAHLLKSSRSLVNEPGFLVLFCVQPIGSTVIAVGIVYIGLTFDLTKMAEILMIASALMLLVLNIISLVVYRHIQEVNAEYTALQLSSLRAQSYAEYYDMLQKQYESQKILIHDIKNHLGVLDNLAREKGVMEISEYITKWQSLPAFTRSIRFCSNSVLNIILMRYSDYCSEKQIRFECDVHSDCISFIDEANLTALFSNLLSNAVESAESSEDKFLEMFIKNTEQGAVVISVVNSCALSPLTDETGAFKTRKQDAERHGFGTKSIERVVKKYDGILKMYYDEAERRFHSIIYFNEPGNSYFDRTK